MQSALALFALQAAVIIAVSRAMGVAAKRLAQPLVVAEIVAGIVLGPSVLGAVSPAVFSTLFPSSSMTPLGVVSQIGVVLFMFVVGLELDPGVLRARSTSLASMGISLAGIVVSMAFAAVLGPWLYTRLSPPSVPPWIFVSFVGLSIGITAFPVLARILSERRLVGTRLGSLVTACAAVDDLIAWCVLAFLTAAARADAVTNAVRTTALSLGVVVLILGVVRPLLGRLARRGDDGLPARGALAWSLALLFFSAWATQRIGIHALFGAFLVGAAVPRRAALSARLAERIEDVVVVVFLPLFFAYSGLRTQIGLLDTPADWLLCAVIIVIACAGKFGGATLVARLTGFSWRDSAAVGVLMNARGLMGLLVLNVGLDVGAISSKLFTMMIIMALVTTIVVNPVMRLLFPKSGFVAAPQDPGPGAARRGYTVLVYVGDEPAPAGAAALACALAGGADDACSALHFEDADTDAVPSSSGRRRAARVLTPLVDGARTRGVEVSHLSFASSRRADDLHALVAAKGADLVLVSDPAAAESVGLQPGSLPVPVAALCDRGLVAVERVVVCAGGEDHDDRAALEVAARLAKGGAHLTVVCAPAGSGTEHAVLRVQARAARVLGALDGVAFHALAGADDDVTALVDAACDLVVVAGTAADARALAAATGKSVLAVAPPSPAAVDGAAAPAGERAFATAEAAG